MNLLHRSPRSLFLALTLALSLGIGCAEDDPMTDGGIEDGGANDGATDDGGAQDAGLPDGFVMGDADVPDAPSTDADVEDGGTTEDGGSSDAGGEDGGTIDSGSPDSGTPDSGTPDSGTPDSGAPDSGTPDSGTPDSGPDTGTPDGGEMCIDRSGTYDARAVPGSPPLCTTVMLDRCEFRANATGYDLMCGRVSGACEVDDATCLCRGEAEVGPGLGGEAVVDFERGRVRATIAGTTCELELRPSDPAPSCEEDYSGDYRVTTDPDNPPLCGSTTVDTCRVRETADGYSVDCRTIAFECEIDGECSCSGALTVSPGVAGTGTIDFREGTLTVGAAGIVTCRSTIEAI